MSPFNPVRNRDILPGRPGLHPTQFAAEPNTDASVSLRKPAEVTSSEVSAWLFGNGLDLPPAAAEVLGERLAATENVNAVVKMRVFQEVFEEHFGYTYEDGENVELAARQLDAAGLGDLALSVRTIAAAARRDARADVAGVGLPADGSPEFPIASSSPDVQSGRVFENIVSEDGRIFTRSGVDAWANEPQAVRFQANRPLTDDEVDRLGPLMGYAMASTIGGEPAGNPERDSPFSFIMSKDTTKGNYRFHAFEEDVNQCAGEGSPIRTTDRAGAGTKGTRKVEGLGDTTLSFEIYYDDVGRS